MKERKPILVSDIWQQYVKDVLKANPRYVTKRKPGCTKNYYIMYGTKEITNFERFSTAIQEFMYHAGDLMIETGGVLVLPEVGKFCLTRVETHPMSRQVDFNKTMRQEPREDGTRKAVYKDHKDWVKVNFLSDLETNYEFIASKPSCKPIEKSMVGRLCNMLKNSKISRLKFEYQALDATKISRKLIKD